MKVLKQWVITCTQAYSCAGWRNEFQFSIQEVNEWPQVSNKLWAFDATFELNNNILRRKQSGCALWSVNDYGGTLTIQFIVCATSEIKAREQAHIDIVTMIEQYPVEIYKGDSQSDEHYDYLLLEQETAEKTAIENAVQFIFPNKSF